MIPKNIPALSIRQPWAWLIIYRGKNIENRSWRTTYRSPVLIHAAKGMTNAEYYSAMEFACRIDPSIKAKLPEGILERGGIIGQAELVDCVSESRSPWFQGPFGFVLAKVQPLPFTPCRGALGLFQPLQPELPTL